MPDGPHFVAFRKRVLGAALSLFRLSGAMNCIARSRAKIARQDVDHGRVISVKRIKASEPVYDLSVAPGHLPEFFANRILTHNSSDGEMRAFEDTIHSAQEQLFRRNLTNIYDIMQISLWGERDPDITYDFNPLEEMNEKEKAEIRKLNVETDQVLVDSGIVSQEEVRRRIVNDPESGYDGLDPDDTPDLLGELEGGLEPEGGRPDPIAGQTGKQPAAKEPTPAKDGGFQNFDNEEDDD
jgi:hypothetical protein